MNILQNSAQNRFEIALEGGAVAELSYVMSPGAGTLTITHTYVPPKFEGQGIASKLTKEALEYAEANSLEVIPLCSFAVSYLARQNRRTQNA